MTNLEKAFDCFIESEYINNEVYFGGDELYSLQTAFNAGISYCLDVVCNPNLTDSERIELINKLKTEIE